jgi:Tfp pilus assembly PilM family ATPase
MQPLHYNTVIGLDVGQHAVKAVRVVRRGRSLTVTHAELLRQPSGTALDWAGAIGRWLEQKGFQGDPCVIGLRGLAAMFHPLALKEEDERPVGQAVAAEISRLNELSPEPMSYAFVTLPERDKVRRVLLVLARPTATDAALAGPRAAGVAVADLIPTPVAMFEAAGAADSERPVLCVNIGMLTTDVAIGSRDGLLFARSFGMGGQFFTDALARAHRLTPAQAESLKTAQGLDAAAEAGAREVLTAAADAWLSEFRTCLTTYRSVVSGEASQPVRLVLCGGGARLRGLDRYVAEKLGLTVERLSRFPAALACEAEPDLYAAAYGLAALATGLGRSRLSLLPTVLREELMLRRQKRYWLASAAMAALILGVSVYGGYRDFRRMNSALAEQRASLIRCQNLARDIDRIDAANRRLLDMSGTVAEMVGNGARFRDVIHAVAEHASTNDWITMIADANAYFAPLRPVPDTEARSRLNGRRGEPEPVPVLSGERVFDRVIVEGYTPDASYATVKKLIADLKTAAFIRTVDLLPDDKLATGTPDDDRWARGGARRFVLDLTL